MNHLPMEQLNPAFSGRAISHAQQSKRQPRSKLFFQTIIAHSMAACVHVLSVAAIWFCRLVVPDDLATMPFGWLSTIHSPMVRLNPVNLPWAIFRVQRSRHRPTPKSDAQSVNSRKVAAFRDVLSATWVKNCRQVIREDHFSMPHLWHTMISLNLDWENPANFYSATFHVS